MAKRDMEAGKASHGEADNVRLVDSCRIQYFDDIVGRARLRIGLDGFGDIRRWISPRGEGDAAMAPREEIELRLPAPMAAAEFMDENNWRARARAFVKQIYAVAGLGKIHLRIPQITERRDAMPPSTVKIVPEV